ncbi:MmcQ/YjbR family DNA-binding protein [Chitinivorax sp. B]|uniref:MmcQ/YjbR family DNA-binding protein n=1 Tax=Chitinivorax sp. B TaxID=2502235 RepID=UPI001485876C|nr:MmcQ/YjbR family DNA-binding protein [Chitinivorax sp. B]
MSIDFDQCRQICAALPLSEVDIKWGTAECHCVVGKMYAIFGTEGSVPPKLSIKVDTRRFLELTEVPGITPAPYLARHHWVTLTVDCQLPADEIAALIRESFQLIAAKLPAKTRQAIASQSAMMETPST